MRVPRKIWIPVAVVAAGAVARKLDQRFGSPVGTRVTQATTAVTSRAAELRTTLATRQGGMI